MFLQPEVPESKRKLSELLKQGRCMRGLRAGVLGCLDRSVVPWADVADAGLHGLEEEA